MSGYDYAYGSYGSINPSTSGSVSAGDDMYTAFYQWDASRGQWAFDYDGFYQTYGTYPTAAGGASSSSQDRVYADLSAAAVSGQSSTASQGGRVPKKKWVPGPKDEDGKSIAGHLKKGQTRKTVLRKAAGKVWEDQTLLEWDPSHKRLFVGNLGNDVTDEVLTDAFKKYPSFSKARVVRQKWDEKSKGYGFVAFADPEDFLRAWKEMDGKHVGSRPVQLKKANEDANPVNINYRKDRLLASNNRYEAYLSRTKAGGAIGKTLRNPHTGKAYGQKR